MVKVKRAPKSVIGVNRDMVARARALLTLVSSSRLQLLKSKTRPQPRDDCDCDRNRYNITNMKTDGMRARHHLYHGTVQVRV
jgi:hypothetical protein